MLFKGWLWSLLAVVGVSGTELASEAGRDSWVVSMKGLWCTDFCCRKVVVLVVLSRREAVLG